MRTTRWMLPAMLAAMLLSGCSTEKKDEIAAAYLKAVSSHNPVAAMGYVAEHPLFTLDNVGELRSRDEVRAWTEWNNAIHTTFTMTAPIVHGDTVSFYLDEGNDWYEDAGLGELRYDHAYMVVQHEKVTTFYARMSDDSFQRLDGVQQAIIGWATLKEPDILDQVNVGGRFLFSRPNARTWLGIVHRWKTGEEYPGR